jgi:hypothetical protein
MLWNGTLSHLCEQYQAPLYHIALAREAQNALQILLGLLYEILRMQIDVATGRN